MRAYHNYTTEEENWGSQRDAGRFHPASEIHWGRNIRHRMTLGCGTSDNVEVFTHQGDLVVLNYNTRYGYCGIQTANLKTGETGPEVFYQEWEADEVCGKRWEDKSSWWLATVLYNNLCHY